MTAARPDFTAQWDGIRAWVTALAGVSFDDANWFDWPQKFAGPLQIRLTPTAMPSVGQELEYDATGDELEASQCLESLLTVSVAVRSRGQDPASFALGYAKLIEAGVLDKEQLAALDGLGVSPSQVVRGTQIMGHSWDNRVEQLCTLDIAFSVSSSIAAGAVDWFNKVRVSSETSNVDGSLLPDVMQLDDEEIGPPP